ncbi:MAG: DUF2254 domain-containing protein [Jiangellaceae bacterium]
MSTARTEAVREYLRSALWLLPVFAVGVALAAGTVLTVVEVPKDSFLDVLVFQGTPDDARTLLFGIAGSVITVMAVMLGLTVVALQLSSTQLSPRLLRNFLQDRPNQVVLAIFVLTFTYATGGLFTVGISRGERIDDYPRLAVTGALLLLFASLFALVYFVHHLAHSIQIDAILKRIEAITLRSIDAGFPGRSQPVADIAEPPAWAVALPAPSSGYVQTAHPEKVLGVADADDVVVRYVPRVGDHVVAGLPLAWTWRASPEPSPDPARLRPHVVHAVRIGFERTHEQDAALGIRQLADVASKALSPAINDPYTAVQAVDRLTVILTRLAAHPLGDAVVSGPTGTVRVIAPGLPFDEYVKLCCAQIRRFGCREPAVVRRLLRMLDLAGAVCATDPARREILARNVRLVLDDAERAIVQPDDFDIIRSEGKAVMERLTS